MLYLVVIVSSCLFRFCVHSLFVCRLCSFVICVSFVLNPYSNIEFKPMRSFAADEVVAYQDASDKDVLRYGRVLRATDDDDDSEDGNQEKMDDDNHGTFDAMNGYLNGDTGSLLSNRVRSVRLELSPGCIAQVLATQVYSFRAARDRPSSSSSSSSSSSTAADAAVAVQASGSASSDEPGGGASESDSALDLAAFPALEGRNPPVKDSSPAAEADSITSSSGAAASGPAAAAAATSSGNLVGAGGGGAVSTNDLLSAVEQMLASADMSLKQDQQQLMAAQLQLQAKLGHATRDLEKSREQIASLSKEVAKVPDEFRCPITCEVMTEVSVFTIFFVFTLLSFLNIQS